MSASIWKPGEGTISVDAESTNLEQVFITASSQTLFTLTDFEYTVGTGSLAVYRNGQRIVLGVDWEETSNTTFTLLGAVSAGETIVANGIIGSTSANADASAASAAASAESANAAAVSAVDSANAAAAADAAAAAAASVVSAASGIVKVSDTDTTAALLTSKIVVSGSLTKTVINPGGNEQIQLEVTLPSVPVPVQSVFGRTGNVTLDITDITPIDGAGSGLDADLLDGQHASAFATAGHTHTGLVPTDSNLGVGCILFCKAISAVSSGATISGSSLQRAGADNAGVVSSVAGALSGTWRNLGMGCAVNQYSTFQRIS